VGGRDRRVAVKGLLVSTAAVMAVLFVVPAVEFVSKRLPPLGR
jgi:hypothetical protein